MCTRSSSTSSRCLGVLGSGKGSRRTPHLFEGICFDASRRYRRLDVDVVFCQRERGEKKCRFAENSEEKDGQEGDRRGRRAGDAR